MTISREKLWKKIQKQEVVSRKTSVIGFDLYQVLGIIYGPLICSQQTLPYLTSTNIYIDLIHNP